MRSRLAIAFATIGAVLIAAMLVMPHVHDRLAATAPMGSRLTVAVPGDGSSSLYTTHRYWSHYDCTVKTAEGRTAALRTDTFSRPLPGGWWPRGELIDAGRLTVSCSSSQGGRFGVGPTRSIGYVLVRAALLVVGVGLLIAAVIVAVRDHRRRGRETG